MAPKEVADLKPELEEKCADHHCAALKKELDKCTARVSGKSHTTETCVQEFGDFLHCVDHCVAPQLFKALK